jgi:hypothetical protein
MGTVFGGRTGSVKGAPAGNRLILEVLESPTLACGISYSLGDNAQESGTFNEWSL